MAFVKGHKGFASFAWRSVMTESASTTSTHTPEDAELWQSLKYAIANSSGFKSWRSEQNTSIKDTTSVEQMVRLYLRETLETLAY